MNSTQVEGSYREYHKGAYSAAAIHPTEAEQEAQRMRAAVCSLVGLRPPSESDDQSLSGPEKPGTEGGNEGVEEGGEGEEGEEREGIAREGGAEIGEEGQGREVRFVRTYKFGVQVLGNIVFGYILGVCLATSCSQGRVSTTAVFSRAIVASVIASCRRHLSLRFGVLFVRVGRDDFDAGCNSSAQYRLQFFLVERAKTANRTSCRPNHSRRSRFAPQNRRLSECTAFAPSSVFIVKVQRRPQL